MLFVNNSLRNFCQTAINFPFPLLHPRKLPSSPECEGEKKLAVKKKVLNGSKTHLQMGFWDCHVFNFF